MVVMMGGQSTLTSEASLLAELGIAPIRAIVGAEKARAVRKWPHSKTWIAQIAASTGTRKQSAWCRHGIGAFTCTTNAGRGTWQLPGYRGWPIGETEAEGKILRRGCHKKHAEIPGQQFHARECQCEGPKITWAHIGVLVAPQNTNWLCLVAHGRGWLPATMRDTCPLCGTVDGAGGGVANLAHHLLFECSKCEDPQTRLREGLGRVCPIL